MTRQLYLSVDVGKTTHHPTGLRTTGTIAYDKPLPQTAPAIRDPLEQLRSTYGPILVIVDQPKTIGTLVITIATSLGVNVAYLPRLTMRRVADLHPGQAKTDARNVFIIAETARTMPTTLRSITVADQSIVELLDAVQVR